MLAAAEYRRPRACAGRIERDAEHVDAARSQIQHGAPCVFDQIARIDDVDIGWLAVGQHEDQLAVAAHGRDFGASVPQRGAQPGRQLRFEMRQPRLDVRTVGLAEIP